MKKVPTLKTFVFVIAYIVLAEIKVWLLCVWGRAGLKNLSNVCTTYIEWYLVLMELIIQ